MKPELYRLERHQHGWLINGPDGHVPANALSELLPFFGKEAVLLPGIAKAYGAVMAVALPQDRAKWEAEVAESLAGLSPEAQWLRGTDTGISSMTLFSVLATDAHLRREAAGWLEDCGRGPGKEMGVPWDGDDFGRCFRLINGFPAWRERLSEVAASFPDSAWPEIVRRWQELEDKGPEHWTSILRGIHAGMKGGVGA